MSENVKGTMSVEQFRKEVRRNFLIAGLAEPVKGYEFLKVAMELLYKKSNRCNVAWCKLYEEIASIACISKSKVERALRHYGTGMELNIQDECLKSLLKSKGNLTVSKFIATVYEWLLIKIEE